MLSIKAAKAWLKLQPMEVTAMSLRRTLVEQRGWCWAIASFGIDAYKASEKGLLAEGINLHSGASGET